MGQCFLVRRGGGIDTSDATATIWDINKGKTAYVNGMKIEGAALLAGDNYWLSGDVVIEDGKGGIDLTEYETLDTSDSLALLINSVPYSVLIYDSSSSRAYCYCERNSTVHETSDDGVVSYDVTFDKLNKKIMFTDFKKGSQLINEPIFVNMVIISGYWGNSFNISQSQPITL